MCLISPPQRSDGHHSSSCPELTKILLSGSISPESLKFDPLPWISWIMGWGFGGNNPYPTSRCPARFGYFNSPPSPLHSRAFGPAPNVIGLASCRDRTPLSCVHSHHLHPPVLPLEPRQCACSMVCVLSVGRAGGGDESVNRGNNLSRFRSMGLYSRFLSLLSIIRITALGTKASASHIQSSKRPDDPI